MTFQECFAFETNGSLLFYFLFLFFCFVFVLLWKSLGLSTYTKSVCFYRKWFHRKFSVFRELFILNQNESFFGKVLFKGFVFVFVFWCSDLRSERNVFCCEAVALVCLNSMNKICYGYFLFWQLHCGKDVFGCPEN